MCRNLPIPSRLEQIFSKPGKIWSRDERKQVVVWLNKEPILRCMLIYTANYLGKGFTAKDAEDTWCRFIIRDAEKKGPGFSQLFDKVVLEFDPDKGKFISWMTGGLAGFCKTERKRLERINNREVAVDLQNTAYDISSDDISANPERSVIIQELKYCIQNCVEKLPEIYHVVFIMRFYEKRKIKEIAEHLILTESAVKQRIRRGKEMFKDCMDDCGG